jgi:hypothetical protein
MPKLTGVCQLCEQKYIYREGKLKLCPACATDVTVREARRLRRHLSDAVVFETPATLTLRQWLTTLEHFAWKCAYCQKNSYEYLEHFIPFIKDSIDITFCAIIGGTSAQNCIPACHKCNSRKGRHSPEYIWKISNNIELGMFPTLAMIERISKYLQIDLSQKAVIHTYTEKDMKAFRDVLRSEGL